MTAARCGVSEGAGTDRQSAHNREREMTATRDACINEVTDITNYDNSTAKALKLLQLALACESHSDSKSHVQAARRLIAG